MFDIFTNEKSLMIDKKFNFKTTLGGVITLLFITVSIAITVVLFQEYFEGKNPQISKYLEVYDNIEDWEVKMKFCFSFEKKYSDSLKLLEWDGDYYLYNVTKLTECSEEQLEEFIPGGINMTKSEDIIHVCKEVGRRRSVDFTMASCEEIPNLGYTIDMKNETCDFTDPNISHMDWSVILLTDGINFTQSNPIQKQFLYAKKNETKNYISGNGSWLKFVNDIGLFFRNLETTYGFDFPKYTHDNYDRVIFEIWFSITEQFVVNKSQLKLPEVLAKIVALIKIFMLIFYKVNGFFVQYSLCKYFLPFYLKSEENLKKYSERFNQELNKTDEEKIIRKEIEALFSLKNYLKSKIYFCGGKNKISENFNFIFEEIKRYLSIERIITKYPIKNENLIEEDNSKSSNKLASILKYFDFLAAEKNLYFDGNNKKFKSRSGKIFTLLYLLSFIPLFYFFGEDFWYKTNPNVQISDLKYLELTTPIEFNPDVPIMIGASKEFTKHVKLLKYLNRNYINFNYSMCTQEDFDKFEKFEFNPQSDYFCTNLNQIVENIFEEGIANYISFVNCTDLELYNIQDENCIKEPYESKNIVNFDYYFITQNFNYSSPDNPVEKVHTHLSHSLAISEGHFYFFPEFEFKLKVMHDDQNIFYVDNKMTTITTASKFDLKLNFRSWMYPGYMSDMYVPFTAETSIIQRKYDKLPEMLARVFSFSQIIKLLFKFINSLIFENFYFHFFLLKNFYQNTDLNKLKDKIRKKLSKNKEISEEINQSSELINMRSITPNEVKEKVEENFRKEVSENIFTLSNYFSYNYVNFCCKKRKNMIKFEVIYKRLIKYLCSENVLMSIGQEKNEKSDEILKEPVVIVKNNDAKNFAKTKDKKKDINSSSLSKNIDIFTKVQIYYIQSNKNFKSVTGGILSCIYLALTIVFFYIFGFDFFFRQNPKVQYYMASFTELDDKSDKNLDVPIIVGYSRNLNNFFEFASINPETGKYELNYSFSPCLDDQFKDVYGDEPRNEEMIYNTTNLKYLIKDRIKGKMIKTDLYLTSCDSDIIKGINSYLQCSTVEDVNQDYSVEFKVKSPRFEIHEKGLAYEVSGAGRTSSYPVRYGHQYHFKQNILIDDEDYFINNPRTTYFTNVVGSELNSQKGYPGLYMFFNMPDNYVTYFYRSYQKFPEMLANVFGMLFFIEVILNILGSFISEYLYSKNFVNEFLLRSDLNLLRSKVNSLNIEDFPEFNNDSEFILFISNNVVNFKNYFLSALILFSGTKRVKVYRLFEKEIISFLSVKGILKISNNFSNQKMELPAEVGLENLNGSGRKIIMNKKADGQEMQNAEILNLNQNI